MTTFTPTTLTDLERAIVQAVAYVDVFDYPLTAAEIHRYLVHTPATPAAVTSALNGPVLVPRLLTFADGCYALPGRSDIIPLRRRREKLAAQLWPLARAYGRLMAALPFVRMVAVTGSLAANNVTGDADIDYFIVTANDRLWLSRALVVGVVRWAARRGVHLCPNYFLAERALSLTERDLYVAREVALMVPVAGQAVYQRLRAANQWTTTFLPNAGGAGLTMAEPARHPLRPAGRLAEIVLSTPLGAPLEQWEMQRKLTRFQSAYDALPEAAFCPDWCKGHIDSHGARIMAAYEERLAGLEKDIDA